MSDPINPFDDQPGELQSPRAGSALSPPREVRWAGLALWIVAGLYATSGLLGLFSRDARAAELRRAGTTLTDAQIDRSVTLRIAVTSLFALALVGLAVLSALRVPRGRRWARITGTVVAGLGAATATVRAFGGGAAAVLAVAVVAASLAAVVLLYRRPANTFFAAHRSG